SEKLVRQVLGETVADDLVARLVQTAGGNAFYLEELIRSGSLSNTNPAPAEHATRQNDAHVGSGSPRRRGAVPAVLPGAGVTTVQARREALEPEARRVLRAASVFGQTFWRGSVVALLNGTRGADLPPGMRPSAGEDSDAQVMAWLDELAVREIVLKREQPKFR